MNKMTRTIPVNQLVKAGDGQGIRVTPRDSVPVQDIINNAKENMALLPKDCFVSKCRAHNEIAWIASAGPSLEKMLSYGYLRKEWFEEGTGNILFTVKHGLPILAKYGFKPHFCVVLDPRPIQGISTHGYLRETLYSKAPKSTKFMVASMTHSSVTRWLIKGGYEIYGWHSAANGLVPTKEHEGLKGVTHFVQGGTCSATRTISLAHLLGFRKAYLIGFDSSLAKEPANPEITDLIDGKPVKKYWTTSIGDSPQFWTTGELIAQIQDLQMFLSDELADVELDIIGTDKDSSLAGALAESVVNKTKHKHYTKKVGTWVKS